VLLIYKDRDGTDGTVRLSERSLAGETTIGRGDEATVTLDDRRVSRIHSSIIRWDDIYVIRDMGSANGTCLNDENVEVAVLRPGDRLRIGSTEFRIVSTGGSDDVTAQGITVEA
jgi:pSer/pThr/pTyr-binding forkhead associated (FHA) protein